MLVLYYANYMLMKTREKSVPSFSFWTKSNIFIRGDEDKNRNKRLITTVDDE
jgi:hypothetical protein